MPTTNIVPAAQSSNHIRFRLFVDFWNVQLTLNEHESTMTARKDSKFHIDWLKFPDCLVKEAVKIVQASSFTYSGAIVYTSFNPKAEEDKSYHKWITTWLDRQPGIEVQCRERKHKSFPKCPVCHAAIADCPKCGKSFSRTAEKGVDTAIATDMIRLAWEGAYDVGILATLDADLVPAVEFLNQKGFRILQAGFPPKGADLSRACWATIDVPEISNGFRRN